MVTRCLFKQLPNYLHRGTSAGRSPSHPISPSQVITLSQGMGWWQGLCPTLGNLESIWEAGHGVPGGAEGPRCCWLCWCDDLCHHNLLVYKEVRKLLHFPSICQNASHSPCHELSLIFFFLSQSFTFHSVMIYSDVYADFHNLDLQAFIMLEPPSLTCCHQNKKSASLVTKAELKCKIMSQKLVHDWKFRIIYSISISLHCSAFL